MEIQQADAGGSSKRGRFTRKQMIVAGGIAAAVLVLILLGWGLSRRAASGRTGPVETLPEPTQIPDKQLDTFFDLR